MALSGVDTVATVVADRRRALAWYHDVLGMREAYVPPVVGPWIEVGPGRSRPRLHLCEAGGTTEPGPTGVTLLTGDIRADHERLRARGVRFLSEPKREEWGEGLHSFVGPDGNEFDLKQTAPGEGGGG